MNFQSQSLRCPHDGALLSPIGNGAHPAQGCQECGGLWLGKKQMEERIGAAAVARLLGVQHGRVTELKCPKDGNSLREFEVRNVLIDCCGVCEGLWFDAGELQTVLAKVMPAKAKTPYLDDKDNTWWIEIPGVGEVITDILGSIFSL